MFVSVPFPGGNIYGIVDDRAVFGSVCGNSFRSWTLAPMLKPEFLAQPLNFFHQLQDQFDAGQIHVTRGTQYSIRRTMRIASSSKHQPVLAGSLSGDTNPCLPQRFIKSGCKKAQKQIFNGWIGIEG
jgi:hypothetical protein